MTAREQAMEAWAVEKARLEAESAHERREEVAARRRKTLEVYELVRASGLADMFPDVVWQVDDYPPDPVVRDGADPSFYVQIVRALPEPVQPGSADMDPNQGYLLWVVVPDSDRDTGYSYWSKFAAFSSPAGLGRVLDALEARARKRLLDSGTGMRHAPRKGGS